MAAEKKKKDNKKNSKQAKRFYSEFIQPVINEGKDGVESKKKIFIVDNKLNKTEIGKILGNYYNVEIVKVNIVNRRPKEKVKRGKAYQKGLSSRKKKAIVTFKDEINLN